MSRAAKQPKNLSLEPSVVERGERYARLHGSNLSKLVNDYLAALPLDVAGEPQSPAVRRLYGAASGGAGGGVLDREEYREHLARKYGVA